MLEWLAASGFIVVVIMMWACHRGYGEQRHTRHATAMRNTGEDDVQLEGRIAALRGAGGDA